jgi:hypothetical protein
MPNIDMDDPILANERNDKVEPIVTKSSTDNVEPSLAIP